MLINECTPEYKCTVWHSAYVDIKCFHIRVFCFKTGSKDRLNHQTYVAEYFLPVVPLCQTHKVTIT